MTTTNAGGLLRAARLARKLTLKEVGAGLDPPVSAAYVSDVELGRRPATAERLPQFTKILNLSGADRHELFRSAGLLPDDLKRRLLEVPEAWVIDFKRVVKLRKWFRAALPEGMWSEFDAVMGVSLLETKKRASTR